MLTSASVEAGGLSARAWDALRTLAHRQKATGCINLVTRISLVRAKDMAVALRKHRVNANAHRISQALECWLGNAPATF